MVTASQLSYAPQVELATGRLHVRRAKRTPATTRGRCRRGSATKTHRSRIFLFDDLVSRLQERFRNLESERTGGREIDDEIELSRLFNRKVAPASPRARSDYVWSRLNARFSTDNAGIPSGACSRGSHRCSDGPIFAW